jgi:hypothetical protein
MQVAVAVVFLVLAVLREQAAQEVAVTAAQQVRLVLMGQPILEVVVVALVLHQEMVAQAAPAS